MKRLETIQALRAFAAWSVVAHHMNQFFRGNIDFGIVGQCFEQYGAMGVDLFFVISGFVIYLTSNGITATCFIQKRARRIIPVYWFYTALTALLIAVVGLHVPATAFSWKIFLQSLVFIPGLNPSGVGEFPLITSGWTINLEIFFYVIYALLIARRIPPFAMVPVLFLVVQSNLEWMRFYQQEILYEFVLGMLVGWVYRKTIHRNNLYIDIALILFSIILLFKYGQGHSYVSVGIPMAMLVVGAAKINEYVRVNKILVMLGDWSYSTYLCHILILSLGLSLITHYQINAILMVSSLLICIALTSRLSYQILEKRFIR